MPKQQKPNAFMLYVKDRQRQLEKEGETFTGTPDAVARIGPEWEGMSKEERVPYEEKAKKRKEAAKKDAMNKVYRDFDEAVAQAGPSEASGNFHGRPG